MSRIPLISISLTEAPVAASEIWMLWMKESQRNEEEREKVEGKGKHTRR
jgi:hypothetical protein